VEYAPDARPRTPLDAACAWVGSPEDATAPHAGDVDVRAVCSRRPVMAIRDILCASPVAGVVGFHICYTRRAAVVEAHGILPKHALFILPRSDGLAAITERESRKRRR
jgi:hypothetical protein